MNIVQLTPGAGAMFCGNCFRDNALVAALRQFGHDVTMIPMYLPLTLDEADQSANTPIFFSGINVYLEQKSTLFRKAPDWLHKFFASRTLLKWAAGRTAKTRASDVGDIMLSMLRGEDGNQARELDELIVWLKLQPKPDVICLSNALLTGMARRLKAELQTSVVCTLQGEDSYLDALPDSHRETCWRAIEERGADVDLFISPSHHFADVMKRRLKIPNEKIKVVYNGIKLNGFGDEWQVTSGENRRVDIPSPVTRHSSPCLGFFARMCKEKGLDTLVEAFIALRKRGRDLKLKIGGSCGPSDEKFVNEQKEQLRAANLLSDVEFHPNLTRLEKIKFLHSLDIFSVPARYGEAFGLYVLESLAAGVPVVQPRAAAFPEIIEATGGGILCEPENPESLANAIEELLLNPERARQLGGTGRKNVFEKFSAEAMAQNTLTAFGRVSENH